MKLILSSVLFMLSLGNVLGQETGTTFSSQFGQQSKGSLVYYNPKPTTQNSIYVELAGSGGFGSFNFEWNFKTSYTETMRWMLRTGISGTYIDKNNGAGFIFPVMVHGVYGQKHGLDVGIGQALTITTRGSVFLRTPLSIGYRLEPPTSRIYYRFSYTPIVSYLVDFQWQHWGGITLGYKLKPRFRR